MLRKKRPGAAHSGFTLVETVAIMVVIGLIVAAVLPRIIQGVKKDVFLEGKQGLRTVREEVVGYVLEHCCLPDNESNKLAHLADRWRGSFIYTPDPNLTCTYLKANSIALDDATGTPMYVSSSPDPVAFIVASKGEDRAFSDEANLRQTVNPIEIKSFGEDGFDDLVDYVTLAYLQGKASCTNPPDEEGGNGGGSTGPPQNAQDFVQYNGDTDLSMGGANIKGSIGSSLDVTLGSGTTLEGYIISGDDTRVGSGSTVTGDILAGDDVYIDPSSSTIIGNIDAQDDIEIGSGSTIEGNVTAGGHLILQPSNVVITGAINAQSYILIGSDTTVNGNVYAGDDVTIYSSGVVINGDLHVDGDLTLGSGTTVNGNIYCSGRVTFQSSNVVVNGSINAGEDVRLASSSHVTGDIVSGDDVRLYDYDNSQVDGTIYAKDDVTVGYNDTVGGDVVYGGDITEHGSIGGSAQHTSPSSIQDPVAPTPPKEPKTVDLPGDAQETAFTAGSTSITPSDGAVIPPNSYRDMYISYGYTVTLQAGDYYFRNINAGWNPSVRLDLSGGPINIFVTNDANFQNVQFQVSGDGSTWVDVSAGMDADDTELASQVYMESHSDVAVASGGEWFGTIYARTSFNFQGTALIGSYYSDGASYFVWGATFIYVASDYAAAHW